MSTYRLRRLSKPDILTRIKPERLLEFLRPHESYLSKRSFELKLGENSQLDCKALAEILHKPTEGILPELIDALYLIDEVAHNQPHDELVVAATVAKIPLVTGETSEDLAVLLWLRARQTLVRLHNETLMRKPKRLAYYSARHSVKHEIDLSEVKLAALTQDMDAWFRENKRNAKDYRCTIIPCRDEDGDCIHFLVRHAMPYRRDSSTKGTVFYQPEFHDVLVYNLRRNEIAIFNKVSSKKQVGMYLSLFGQHFFGDENHFSQQLEKYTLQPLRDRGANALACHDIPGMDRVKLTEFQIRYRGGYNNRVVHKSDDYFAWMAQAERKFPDKGELTMAKFLVQFKDSKKARNVTIVLPNVSALDRKDDAALIEEWLEKRGFIKSTPEPAAIAANDS